MGNELLTGFLAGQGDSNNRDGGFFGNEGLWAVIILAIIFGWGRNGFGGNNGDSSGMGALPYVMAAGTQGGLTRADRAIMTETIDARTDTMIMIATGSLTMTSTTAMQTEQRRHRTAH